VEVFECSDQIIRREGHMTSNIPANSSTTVVHTIHGAPVRTLQSTYLL